MWNRYFMRLLGLDPLSSRQEYKDLSDQEQQAMLQKDDTCPMCGRCARNRKVLPLKPYIVIPTLLLLSTGVFFAFLAVFPAAPSPSMNSPWRQTVQYSPVLDEVEIPVYTSVINGTFFTPPFPSIARQEPGPENDAAWMDLADGAIFGLSREEVIKLGKDPTTAAQLDKEYWGVSEDVYVGQFDISHQIHCLDMMRRKAFQGYPGYQPANHKRGLPDWTHLSHCVDMLLQFLLCNSDPAVFTMTYVEFQETPFPDFNIQRQCRDYDALMSWAEGRRINGPKIRNEAPRPKDAFVWPNPFAVSNPNSETGLPLRKPARMKGDL